ncbi:MAG TPA: rRNA maturation RNase YbeY [Candidatus Baltobacteraceae bacterium]|nr:rRNA maturation RNase YbeY [Candidatus Baltobacteraceae bacterium]
MPVARRVAAPVSDAWVRKLVAAALKGAKAKTTDEVGVVFVADKEMIALNTAHRHKRKTTDVLSFGNDGAWPGEGKGLLGDIVISMPQIRRQAAKAGKPVRDELAMMLVHGTLHLLGYDHETVKDEKVMFPLQKRILKTLGYA